MPRPVAEVTAGRVVAHFDLDCFYVQVEQRLRPELKGLPTAVVQYNPWKGGGLIAVGYEARQMGVKRNMRGDEAREKCPGLTLVQVPVAHGKADLTVYRNAGSEVVAILQRGGKCERASIDEAYVDLTASAAARHRHGPYPAQLSDELLKTHVLGLELDGAETAESAVERWVRESQSMGGMEEEQEALLACGAAIVAELREAVLQETGFTCSAGIAHNKLLAKLASGLHKPNQQTLVRPTAVADLLHPLPIHKMKQLGGKMGERLKVELGVASVGDLLPHSLQRLQDLLGPNAGEWLWRAARGQDGTPVQDRVLPKSHSSGKTFTGPAVLRSMAAVEYWVRQLAEELQERLDRDYEENGRSARLFSTWACFVVGRGSAQVRRSVSKSGPLREGVEAMSQDAAAAVKRMLPEGKPSGGAHSGGGDWGVTSLGVGASNIVAPPAGNASIKRFLVPSGPGTRRADRESEPQQQSRRAVDAAELASGHGALASAPMTASPATSGGQSSPASPNLPDRQSSEKLSPLASSWVQERGDYGPPAPASRATEAAAECLVRSKTMKSESHSYPSDNGTGFPREPPPVETNDLDTGQVQQPLPANERRPSSGEEAGQQVQVLLFGSSDAGPDCQQRVADSLARDTFVELEPQVTGAAGGEHEEHTAPQWATSALPVNSNHREEQPLGLQPAPQSQAVSWGQNHPSAGHSAQASAGRRRAAGVSLEALWSRALSTGVPRVSDSGPNQQAAYRAEDIDEAVLAELPADIQRELRMSLAPKRQRLAGTRTIANFFKPCS